MTPKEILALDHKRWLDSEVTKFGKKRLLQHEEELVTRIASASLNKDLTADHVRLLASQLSTTRNIRTLLYDTETFVEKCGSGE